MTPEDMVDLSRYPLHMPEGRARIVAEARAALAEAGSALLPGFLRPGAVAAMAEEATRLLPRAHRRAEMLGAYERAPEPWMEADHPVRRTSPYRMLAVAADHLEPGGPTLGIYEWDPLTELVADMLSLPRLYRVADPMLRCNYTILGEGDSHGWHFDGNAFVVSLLVQKPEAGGVFEFAPAIRDEGAENFEEVRAVMDGRSPRVRRIAAEPGTLALFQGSRALHRVTEVRGPRPRITALFSYDTRPGMTFGEGTQLRVFGRRAGPEGVPA